MNVPKLEAVERLGCLLARRERDRHRRAVAFVEWNGMENVSRSLWKDLNNTVVHLTLTFSYDGITII